MTKYKIKVKGYEPGSHRADDEEGIIIGPFGVSAARYNGFHRVTHLHSGLKISELGSSRLESAISAARDLAERVPWWASHNTARIAETNGLTQSELKRIVNEISDKHGCDGRKDERIHL